jgi:hypothetical protein
MPTTVTASNGVSYHLWQLPDLSTPEPEDTIEFTTLDNDLADGFRSSVLFGSNNGVRSWTLKVPTSAALSVLPSTVTDPSGALVSRNEYLRSLYAENKLGQPFAYQDPVSGQYYLVDFAADPLSFQRVRGVSLYSTTVKLVQRRLSRVTIFNLQNETRIWGDYQGPTSFSSSNWANSISGTSDRSAAFVKSGDVVDVAAAQNGLQIKRFSNTTNNGYVNISGSRTVYEAFFVMKMREATFSTYGGILTGDGATAYGLSGSLGTTKFDDAATSLGWVGYEYRKNGVLYANSNQQAPMNEWGIVHIRYATGWTFTNPQIGKHVDSITNYAELDLGEVILASALISPRVAREITEYLTIKWGITG